MRRNKKGWERLPKLGARPAPTPPATPAPEGPPAAPAAPGNKWLGVLAAAALGAAVLWAYWPILLGMAERWSDDPQYSHGYLVPAFAGVLLWLRRGRAPSGLSVSAWGIPLLLAGAGLRLAGVYLYLTWLEGASLLPTLAGLAVLLGGRPALRWAGPSVAFLFFMVPLPYRVQTGLAFPLQRVATEASAFTLQTLGLPALAEGNIILLNDVRIGVVEACSGLTMMMTFFALATAVALLIDRPALDRVVVVLSAAPIAILANVLRITATGVLHETAGSELANAVFHDWAGWLMMPLALGLLALVLQVLAHLLVKPRPKDEALADLFRMKTGRAPAPRKGPAVAPAAPSAAT